MMKLKCKKCNLIGHFNRQDGELGQNIEGVSKVYEEEKIKNLSLKKLNIKLKT
jgi:hypothetical protein